MVDAVKILCAALGGGLWLIFATNAWGFNATGHQVAGYVAEANMCQQTLKVLSELDGERNVANAGTWADEIRRYDHFDRVKPWHYINIADNLTVAEAIRGTRKRGGDVLFAIDYFSDLLGDESADRLDRAVAYRFLVHFIADVHQPLHVGREADRGGNWIRVRVDGRRTNLHAYWDGYDLKEVVDNPRDYADYLQQLFSDKSANGAGSAADWAQESKDVRPRVYALGRAVADEDAALSREYRQNAMEIINLRLYRAGLRIAATLDGMFCGASRESSVNSGPK